MNNTYLQPKTIPGVLGDSTLYVGLDAGKYHSDIDVQSCSLLKPMLVSPAHYKAQFLAPRKKMTDAMRFGILLHLLVLEPFRFGIEYAVFPGRIESRRDDEYKAFALANPGKEIIDEPALYEARVLVQKILNCAFRGRKFGDYLAEGIPEASIYFTDPSTGIRCRSRIDLLHPEYTFDLKSTIYAQVREWMRHALDLDYDMQAYMYSLAACLQSGSTEPKPFVFIAAESSMPHSVSAYTAGNSFLLEGGRKYKEALSGYVSCNAIGHWPGLDSEETLELEYWQAGPATPAWQNSLRATAAAI